MCHGAAYIILGINRKQSPITVHTPTPESSSASRLPAAVFRNQQEAVVGVDLVVDLPFFQRVHALEQAAMDGHEPAHGDKGIDDVDADLDGSFAAQHRREHGHALFGEGVRMVPSPAMGT